MAKKAVKRSGAAKKAAAKKKASKGPVNRKEVREEIAGLVATKVAEMTTAMIGEANKGCLPQFKFLLEVSEVFPPASGGEGGTEDSNALAQFLLDRLRLPNAVEDENAEDGTGQSLAIVGVEEKVSVE
ncbi:MAG TPA: hypothetical protein VK466_10235 [Terriglobales bacterium]|nr:hypothetical protein [Terriglobales bacterium]